MSPCLPRFLRAWGSISLSGFWKEPTVLRVRDYTLLTPGTKFNGGDIQTCEHCGKPGLLEEVNGKKWFTHSETVGFDSRGNPVMLWETCPPLVPRTTP